MGLFLVTLFQAVLGIIIGRLIYSGVKYVVVRYKARRNFRNTLQPVADRNGRQWVSQQGADGRVTLKPYVEPLPIVKSKATKVPNAKASITNLDEIF